MKYKIKDAEKEYIVEEIEEKDEDKTIEEKAEEEIKTCDDQLTVEEIVKLKKLAALSDKIADLINKKEEIKEKVEEKEKIADEEEIDEEEIEEEEIYDSKNSFGAIQKAVAKDSLDVSDVETAWQKRYGG